MPLPNLSWQSRYGRTERRTPVASLIARRASQRLRLGRTASFQVGFNSLSAGHELNG
jgi:hypothetical protein